MTKYIVTDEALKKFILKYKNASDEDIDFIGIRNTEFGELLDAFISSSEFDRLENPDYQFASDFYITLLKGIAQALSIDSDGGLVSPSEATTARNLFYAKNGTPDFLDIPIAKLDAFLDFIEKEITSKALGPYHELAFRVYFGHERKIATGKYEYCVLIVPIASPKLDLSGPLTIRDHKYDIEKRLYVAAKKFIGLIVSKARIDTTTNIFECAELVKNKDHASLSETAYFTAAQFEKFKYKLAKLPHALRVFFGRTKDAPPEVKGDPVLVILSFIDANGKEIESDMRLVDTVGVYFDQNDLMPPPFPISNSAVKE